jgi:hypothetical protein
MTDSSVLPPGDGPQYTAAGYLLANAMTNLPEQTVSHVLTDSWGRWLNWHTTDAQLAAALGIRMPSAPASVPVHPLARGKKHRPLGQTIAPGPGNGPQAPLCTA